MQPHLIFSNNHILDVSTSLNDALLRASHLLLPRDGMTPEESVRLLYDEYAPLREKGVVPSLPVMIAMSIGTLNSHHRVEVYETSEGIEPSEVGSVLYIDDENNPEIYLMNALNEIANGSDPETSRNDMVAAFEDLKVAHRNSRLSTWPYLSVPGWNVTLNENLEVIPCQPVFDIDLEKIRTAASYIDETFNQAIEIFEQFAYPPRMQAR